MEEKKVGIISAGAWGTAIGKHLGDNGHRVLMWDVMEDVVEDINSRHRNDRYLPGVQLPGSVRATVDITEAAAGQDFLIIATPSLYILDTLKKFIHVPDIMEGRTLIGVLTKGFIDTGSGAELITRTLEKHLPGSYQKNLVYISGPSHAEEVARGKLTGLISASLNGKNSILFRKLLTTQDLLVFSSMDVVGVQVAAAVKNVIAIAFGILDALLEKSDRFGDNTESFLLAAGLIEIQIIGRALGATHPETFTSIAGIGDLDVTCRSRHGRNRRFGREIILKDILAGFQGMPDILANINRIGYLPEGVVACYHVIGIAETHKLKLPVSTTVYRILNREADPENALSDMLDHLTARALGIERHKLRIRDRIIPEKLSSFLQKGISR